MDTQVGVMPWTDLQGNVHNQEREHLANSLRDCVKFHLLLVFLHDAAEHQKYYTSRYFKNPRKIQLRNFSDRIKILNSLYTLSTRIN